MTREEIEAAKAAFLARGGAIKQLPTDATNGMTGKDWQQAVRTPGFQHVRTDADAMAEIERRGEQQMERVREAAHQGGRAAAIRALNDED